MVFSRAEAKLFDWDRLRPEKDTFPKGQAGDLLYSVPLIGGSGPRLFLYLLVEHKAWYDKGIWNQFYDYLFYIDKTVREQGGEPPLCMPVPLYHGKKPWPPIRTFQEGRFGDRRKKIPSGILKNMINYEIRLIDLNDPETAEKARHLKSRGAFQTLKRIWTLKPDPKELGKLLAQFKSWPGDRKEITTAVYDYLKSAIPKVTPEILQQAFKESNLQEFFHKGGPMDFKEYIAKQARLEGMEKGLQQGKEQGMQQGHATRLTTGNATGNATRNTTRHADKVIWKSL